MEPTPETADQNPPKIQSPSGPVPQPRRGIDLLNAVFPAHNWAVEGLIPEGESVLAARPKTGKSWLALNLALSVAAGRPALGTFRVVRGAVLYLALEDSYRRLQQRLRRILELQRWPIPEAIEFCTAWPPPGRGGMDHLAEWCASTPNPRLIVVDTFARFRDRAGFQNSIYDADYAASSALQQFAIDRGIAIAAITHTTKPKGGPDADPLDEVQNSTGITAAADVVGVIKRPRLSREGTLFVTGRDIEEREFLLTVDHGCIWRAEELEENDPFAGCTPEQRQTLAILRDAGKPVSPAELARLLRKDVNAVNQMLIRLHKAGSVNRPSFGLYEYPHQSQRNYQADTLSDSDGVDAAELCITPFD